MPYVSLARFSLTGAGADVAAPASGGTATLFDSSASPLGPGQRFKRLIVRLRTSHDGAADGLKFQEKSLSGDTFRDLVAYTHKAATAGVPFASYRVSPASGYVKVTYQNSANVLTEFEGEILGDTDEA